MFKQATYLTILCTVLLLGAGLSESQAQVKKDPSPKIGYVNPTAILQKMPSMKAVQQRIKNYVNKKQEKLTQQRDSLQQKIATYQQRQSVMSKEAKQEEQKKLGKLRANLQKAQRQAQQDIRQKQQSLVQPLNEDIQKSIDKVAKEMGLAYVINTTTSNGDVIILYASDSAQKKYDITSKVMDDLGI
jgi:outer membrane protein